MRKARVFGQVLGVPGMVIEDVTVQTDPDGDEEILVVSVRPDARSAGRCATCRRRCPGYDVGVGTRRWRTVDTGTTRTFLQAAAPRVQCPEHGVLVAHTLIRPESERKAASSRNAKVRELVRDREGCCIVCGSPGGDAHYRLLAAGEELDGIRPRSRCPGWSGCTASVIAGWRAAALWLSGLVNWSVMASPRVRRSRCSAVVGGCC